MRRYRRGGLDALADKPRPRSGVKTLTPDQIELFCQLKREVPERSLDRLLLIASDMKLIEPGTVSRSTLHRVLQQRGLSKRPTPVASVTDLDRFEADSANDLWQSDMLAGPWLPDPARPGKVRRAWLYAFLDDHSRLLLAGRFAFKGDLPALELVFRQAVRRYGVPRRVYYDNGATYRAKHMQQVVAALGIHRLVFTTPYRPMGHGKIEAFNRLCKAACIAEVRASSIQTLDELNAAFGAWVSRFYNKRLHGETGQTPQDRWRAGLNQIRHIDETAVSLPRRSCSSIRDGETTADTVRGAARVVHWTHGYGATGLADACGSGSGLRLRLRWPGARGPADLVVEQCPGAARRLAPRRAVPRR